MAALRSGVEGFTLAESAIAVALFACIALALLVGLRSSARGLDGQIELDNAASIARDAAEVILADRRNPARGFTYLAAVNYPAASRSIGGDSFTRSVSITDLAAGVNDATYNTLCPALSIACKVVRIDVTLRNVVVASLHLLLVNTPS